MLMQETTTIGPLTSGPGGILPGQSFAALLALVGTRKMDVETLRKRIGLAPFAFGGLLSWLQREYLVNVVPSPEGDELAEKVELTEKGESALISLLETMCELPELH